MEHGEEIVASKARSLSHEIAESARARTPQSADYDEDKMLLRLIRESLFHRDSERRHLAALLVAASPFGDTVTDELLALLNTQGFPGWMRARAATLTRYLGNDQHRMRMLKFLDDPDSEVAVAIGQAFGHLTFTELSDQAIRSSLADLFSAGERAKLYALGMTGSPGLEAIMKSNTSTDWQKSAARWWAMQGRA